MKVAFADLRKVLLPRHAAVHHHRLSLPEAAKAVLQTVQHVRQVAAEHFVRLRKAVVIDGKPHHHLLAVRPLVARVAAGRLRVGQRRPFEITAGQVDQIHRGIQIEQVALPPGQRCLDRFPLVVQTVEVAVQRRKRRPREMHPEQVVHRRPLHPVPHGVLR